MTCPVCKGYKDHQKLINRKYTWKNCIDIYLCLDCGNIYGKEKENL
jgi:hypothetical protein